MDKRLPTLENFMNESVDEDKDLLINVPMSREYYRIMKKLEPYNPIDTENGILITNYKEKITTPDKLGYHFMTGDFSDLKPRPKAKPLRKDNTEVEVKAVKGYWQPILDKYPGLSKKFRNVMQDILNLADRTGKVSKKQWKLLDLMKRGELKPESFSPKN